MIKQRHSVARRPMRSESTPATTSPAAVANTQSGDQCKSQVELCLLFGQVVELGNDHQSSPRTTKVDEPQQIELPSRQHCARRRVGRQRACRFPADCLCRPKALRRHSKELGEQRYDEEERDPQRQERLLQADGRIRLLRVRGDEPAGQRRRVDIRHAESRHDDARDHPGALGGEPFHGGWSCCRIAKGKARTCQNAKAHHIAHRRYAETGQDHSQSYENSANRSNEPWSDAILEPASRHHDQ